MAGVQISIAAAALLAATTAQAGEAPCWFDAGVLVVPAEVAGIAGDYILDTGSPRTLLDETRAQEAGFEATEMTARVRVGGLDVETSLAVTGLDVRTWNLPTPVAGVIGADVLKAYVLDVSFAPCRVRLSEPGKAPRFPGGRRLELAWDAGRPVAVAEVRDGARRLEGPFVLATGSNAPLRLADDLAAVPAAPKPDELYPEGVWLARLPRLDLAGMRLEDVGAGLIKPEGETAGVIGAQVLARYRLRFDFPAGELVMAPARR